MKLTKAQIAIFEKYGIEADPQTDKIRRPDGTWINLPLVDGNAKIGKGAYHFSILPGNFEYTLNIALTVKETVSKKSGKPVKTVCIDDENPQIVTVMGTCVCSCEGCYAQTGNYNYRTTLAYLAIRTITARFYLAFLEAAIKAQIEAFSIELIRIHAAGDFFSKEYAQMWRRIAEAFPGVTFWTYTKVKQFETLFDGLSNANIVKSVIDILGIDGFNYGHCDYIMMCYKVLKAAGFKVHICFCGIEEYARIDTEHCTNCKSCSECDYVLFIEHSTEYKAEEDPLFPELVKMILSQERSTRKAA